MKTTMIKLLAFGAMAMLVAGCATTQLVSTWKDPAYQARPGKIMVVGMTKSPVTRRLFEDEFVRQLGARGTAAVASYKVLPEKAQNDQVIIAAKMKEQGADVLLITTLLSTKTVKTYVPGTIYFPPTHSGKWPNYYNYGYQAITTPSYVTESDYADVETNLYDAANEKLIWAASSETGLFGSKDELIKSYIEVMIKSMATQGVLGK